METTTQKANSFMEKSPLTIIVELLRNTAWGLLLSATNMWRRLTPRSVFAIPRLLDSRVLITRLSLPMLCVRLHLERPRRLGDDQRRSPLMNGRPPAGKRATGVDVSAVRARTRRRHARGHGQGARTIHYQCPTCHHQWHDAVPVPDSQQIFRRLLDGWFTPQGAIICRPAAFGRLSSHVVTHTRTSLFLSTALRHQ